MPNWLSEFLYILALSRKTQWAIILGFVFFIGIHIVGHVVLSDFELQGSYKGVRDIIVHEMAKKYDKAALIALVSFLGLACRCYLKDKNRFW